MSRIRAGFRGEDQAQAGKAKAVLKQGWDMQPGLSRDNDKAGVRNQCRTESEGLNVVEMVRWKGVARGGLW